MDLKFSMSELIHSDFAVRYNINNMPDINSSDCMLELIYYCLQPLRQKTNRAMIITSGFRNSYLTSQIGGVKTSQHCKGQAVDFHFDGWTIQQGIDFIKKSGIEYDQLINEYDKWIHISFVKGKNRKQCFKL